MDTRIRIPVHYCDIGIEVDVSLKEKSWWTFLGSYDGVGDGHCAAIRTIRVQADLILKVRVPVCSNVRLTHARGWPNRANKSNCR
jgi:hypothetical protein